MGVADSYRVYIHSRDVAEVQEMIDLNPDVTLRQPYVADGYTTSDVELARSYKRMLQQCLDYAFQTERASRRNQLGRHQTAGLTREWDGVRVVIEPDPDAGRLLR